MHRLFNMNKSPNQEVRCLFHIHKMHLLPFLVLSETEMTYVPTLSYTASTNEIPTLSFPSSLRKKTLSGGAPRIGHFKEYLSPGSLCFEFLFDWLSHFFLTSWHSLICPPYFPPSSRVFIIRMRVSNRFRGPGLALFEAGSLDFKGKWGRRFWATDVNRKWGCPKMKKKSPLPVDPHHSKTSLLK